MFIRSERLFLRPVWAEDWQALLAGLADEAVVRQLPRAPWPYTEDDARNFVAMPQPGRLPHCVIVNPHVTDGERVIGSIGLHECDGEVMLSYWIARPHWGQGYATEAVRAMITLARLLGHRRIVSSPFLDNPASAKVLSRAGFRATGDAGLRHSVARGETVLAMPHVLELDGPGDCGDNDGGPDDGSPDNTGPRDTARLARAA